jgi:hypothetical protein
MEKRSFGSISLTRLMNNDFSSLLQFTLDVAKPVRAQIGDVGSAALINFETNALPFISQTNRLRESPLTVQINSLHIHQIDLLAEIKRIIVFEKKSRSEASRLAAEDLYMFFKLYWDLSKRKFGAQIKDTTELVAKYEADSIVVGKATTIGINTVIGELKTTNITLTKLYLDRNEEVGGRGTSGTDLRPAALDGYVQFCTVMEQLVNLMPNEVVVTLFNNMDALRVKAHALISTGKDKPEEAATVVK